MARKIFLLSVLAFLTAYPASAGDLAGHNGFQPLHTLIRPVIPDASVLSRLAVLAGIDASQIRSLKASDIFPAQEASQAMKEYMKDDGYAPLCSLGTLKAGADGCYVMAVDIPGRLAGTNAGIVRVYGLTAGETGAAVAAASSDRAVWLTDEEGNEPDELADTMLILIMLESGNPVCMFLAGAFAFSDSGGTDSCGGDGGVMIAALWLAAAVISR